MNLEELRKYKSKLSEIAKRHHAGKLRVFGSVARGDERKNSDIDILVKLGKKASLYDLAAMNTEMEKILRCKVDVVPDDSVNKRFERIVLGEAVPL